MSSGASALVSTILWTPIRSEMRQRSKISLREFIKTHYLLAKRIFKRVYR